MKKDTRDGSGLTVGVDLGDKWSRYCVLDQQGQILEEDTIAATGQAFRKLFSDRPAARVVIEVGLRGKISRAPFRAFSETAPFYVSTASAGVHGFHAGAQTLRGVRST